MESFFKKEEVSMNADLLREEIGDEAFNALMDPKNLKEVKTLAERLMAKKIPTKIDFGDRVYDILTLRQEGEYSYEEGLAERCEKMNASFVEDDGKYILKNQSKIPVNLRNLVFVFPEWLHPDHPDQCCLLYFDFDGEWVISWRVLSALPCVTNFRFLRRA